jgi:hypothetical protein
MHRSLDRSKMSIVSGGVAQWASHPTEELQTLVRFPLGYKVYRGIIAMLLCIIDLICILCVLKKEE